jgi:hypothetical protein
MINESGTFGVMRICIRDWCTLRSYAKHESHMTLSETEPGQPQWEAGNYPLALKQVTHSKISIETQSLSLFHLY